MKTSFSLLTVVLFAVASVAQVRVQPIIPANVSPSKEGTLNRAQGNARNSSDTSPGSPTVSDDFVLGPGDVLALSEPNLDDYATLSGKTFRVDAAGKVAFPIVGQIQAAGLTTSEVQAQVNKRLGKVLKEPDAILSVTEFHSQPVSVLGAVNSPGVFQVSGSKNLYAVLSLAGGLREDASSTVRITRSLVWGDIPLQDAKRDQTEQFSVASVKVKLLMSGSIPAENIRIMPDDIITVPKAEVVYAVGAVSKPGGFILGEDGRLSTLQVISLAEGLVKTAAPTRAQIIRSVPGATAPTEIAVNVKSLLEGKSADVPLQPGDILFIPNSAAKTVSYRTVDAIINAATGLVLYGAKL